MRGLSLLLSLRKVGINVPKAKSLELFTFGEISIIPLQ